FPLADHVRIPRVCNLTAVSTPLDRPMMIFRPHQLVGRSPIEGHSTFRGVTRRPANRSRSPVLSACPSEGALFEKAEGVGCAPKAPRRSAPLRASVICARLDY